MHRGKNNKHNRGIPGFPGSWYFCFPCSIYHGSVRELSDGVPVFNGADGEPDVFGSINVYTGINGEYRDINGNPADIDEPRLAELFEWAQGPEAVRRGNSMMWFFGTVICVMTAVF